MKRNDRLYIATINVKPYTESVYILICFIKHNYIAKRGNSFINLLPAGYFQTPCPLSTSSSPTQQHHEDAALYLLPQHHEDVALLSSSPTHHVDHDLQPFRLSDHDLLPSHQTLHQRRRFYTPAMVDLGLGKLFFNRGSF